MEPKLYQEPHRITYYEADMTSRISLETVLNLAVLVSEDQINYLHVGSKRLQNHHLGWVVIQYSIQINQLPKNNDRVVLATSSRCYNPLLAEREFWIKDRSGRVYAKIDSNWILLDLRTRRLIPIQPQLIKPYGAERVALLPHLRRPKPIQNPGGVRSRNYRVRYDDIDINHHVNNAKYLSWMTDVLSPGFLAKYIPRRVEIKFSHEVRYGTQIKSRVKLIHSRGRVITKHEIRFGHQLAAVANVDWQARK